ncbi:MAG: SagB/ThcOx family dehydrogenase [Candidatus Margulisbacteria bacterium]|jgi:SagB-type dehydrogenase family enzyme|nr:SagB/ThcOx family dehydrogenase [Candidatus Margulisiibacteriota bacterium]
MLKKALVSLLLLGLTIDLAVAARKQIVLPNPKLIGKMTLEESLFRRRSERAFLPNELTMEQISQLLWAAQGITEKSWGFRTAPSSGSLYPLTIYIAKKDGVFQYLPDGHKLIEVATEDKRSSLVRAALGQGYIAEAPLVIIVAGNFRITEAKYGQRAYRYMSMEIGHVGENVLLQAVALGLVAVPIGAFWDDVVAKALGLPETQDPFYLIPVGYLRSGS